MIFFILFNLGIGSSASPQGCSSLLSVCWSQRHWNINPTDTWPCFFICFLPEALGGGGRWCWWWRRWRGREDVVCTQSKRLFFHFILACLIITESRPRGRNRKKKKTFSSHIASYAPIEFIYFGIERRFVEVYIWMILNPISNSQYLNINKFHVSETWIFSIELIRYMGHSKPKCIKSKNYNIKINDVKSKFFIIYLFVIIRVYKYLNCWKKKSFSSVMFFGLFAWFQ